MTEKKIIPAYITVAFAVESTPRVTIQQIQYREVEFVDGVAVDEGVLLPPRLIKAPLPNDTIEATLEEALGPLGAAASLAIAGSQQPNG
jgi:hypothetical protein